MSIQKIVIRQYSMDRPQPLLEVHRPSKNRFAEFAGGATAECAVVCCCIPLSLVNLLVMAVYGVPARLYRKALRRKRRRRLMKRGLVVEGDGDRSSCDGAELLICPTEMLIESPAQEVVIGSPAPVQVPERCVVMKPMEVDVELEDEMWRKFYGTGFWRSVSQRVD